MENKQEKKIAKKLESRRSSRSNVFNLIFQIEFYNVYDIADNEASIVSEENQEESVNNIESSSVVSEENQEESVNNIESSSVVSEKNQDESINNTDSEDSIISEENQDESINNTDSEDSIISKENQDESLNNTDSEDSIISEENEYSQPNINYIINKDVSQEILTSYYTLLADEEAFETKQDETFKAFKVNKDLIGTQYNSLLQKLSQIDSFIIEKTTGWEISRIDKVDLAILRLAIYEFLYDDEVPKVVAINEAVELAKEYSSEKSYKFINGVLAKIK